MRCGSPSVRRRATCPCVAASGRRVDGGDAAVAAVSFLYTADVVLGIERLPGYLGELTTQQSMAAGAGALRCWPRRSSCPPPS